MQNSTVVLCWAVYQPYASLTPEEIIASYNTSKQITLDLKAGHGFKPVVLPFSAHAACYQVEISGVMHAACYQVEISGVMHVACYQVEISGVMHAACYQVEISGVMHAACYQVEISGVMLMLTSHAS